MLDEGAGNEEARARDLAPLDAPPDLHAVLERCAEIAGEGHAGPEQLPRGGGHDLVAEAGAVRGVPVLVVAVTQDHEVHVHVGEPGKNGHAACVDLRHARRDGDLAAPSHGRDAVSGDEDDSVVDRAALVSVYDAAPHEREGYAGGVGLGGGGAGRRQKQNDGGGGRGDEPAHALNPPMRILSGRGPRGSGGPHGPPARI